MRVTIACPEAMIADANQLARCLGLGPEDDQTYGAAIWRDAVGHSYAVASAIVGAGFTAAATSPLVVLPWGADMEAAARAQANIRIGGAADPAHLVAVFGDDVQSALTELGVMLATDVDAE